MIDEPVRGLRHGAVRLAHANDKHQLRLGRSALFGRRRYAQKSDANLRVEQRPQHVGVQLALLQGLGRDELLESRHRPIEQGLHLRLTHQFVEGGLFRRRIVPVVADEQHRLGRNPPCQRVNGRLPNPRRSSFGREGRHHSDKNGYANELPHRLTPPEK